MPDKKMLLKQNLIFNLPTCVILTLTGALAGGGLNPGIIIQLFIGLAVIEILGAVIPVQKIARAIGNIQKEIRQEERTMTKTIQIKGMMCAHCEAHVKKALEALDGVTGAVPSHEQGTAVLELNGDVPEEALRRAVEEAGYEYVG